MSTEPAQIRVWPKPYTDVPRKTGGYFSPGSEIADYDRYTRRLLAQGDLLDHDPLLDPPWIPWIYVESVRTGVVSAQLSRFRGLYHDCSVMTLGGDVDGDGRSALYRWNEDDDSPEAVDDCYGILPRGRWRRSGSIGGGGGGGGGSPGVPGTQWRQGAGAPANTLGINGDFYINTLTGQVLQRVGGVYSVVMSMAGVVGPAGPAGTTGAAGSAGSLIRSGAGAPSDSLGANGDVYINSTNGAVYQKSAGTYSVIASFIGPAGAQGPAGATGPAGAAGAPGANGQNFDIDAIGNLADRGTYNGEAEDFSFLAQDTGDLYIRVGSSGWSPPIPFRGPVGPAGPTGPTGPAGAAGATGAAGTVIRTGTGAPSSGIGVNGDYYINGANGDLYLKSSGSYSIVANLRGPTGAAGAAGATGATGPAGATGATGSAGATGPQGIQGVAGTAGSRWYSGTGAPSSGVGVNGDYYVNTVGVVYSKSGGTWSVFTNLGVDTSIFARLAGGNTFTGDQIVSGNVVVLGQIGSTSLIQGYNISTGQPGRYGGDISSSRDLLALIDIYAITGTIYTGENPPAGAGAGDIAANGDVIATGNAVASNFRYASTRQFNRMVDTHSGPTNAVWTLGPLGTWGAKATNDGDSMRFNLNKQLKQNALITRVRVRVQPASARSGTSRMSATLVITNIDGTQTFLGTAQYDDGTTNRQYIVLTVANGGLPSGNVDLTVQNCALLVSSGKAGANGDTTYSAELQFIADYAMETN